jgi:hypothetical protein
MVGKAPRGQKQILLIPTIAALDAWPIGPGTR